MKEDILCRAMKPYEGWFQVYTALELSHASIYQGAEKVVSRGQTAFFSVIW